MDPLVKTMLFGADGERPVSPLLNVPPTVLAATVSIGLYAGYRFVRLYRA